MKQLITEIKTTHKANLRVFLRREKAWIGYIILLVGVVIALTLSFEALRAATERDEITRGIICKNTITQDRQALTNLITSSGHELIEDFHLTLPQAAMIIHRQLEASARERKTLQPSKPASACTSKITIVKIHSRVNKGSAKALKLAEDSTGSKSTGLFSKPTSPPSTRRHSAPAPVTHQRVTPQQVTPLPTPATRAPSVSVSPPAPTPSGNFPKASGGTKPPIPNSEAPKQTQPETSTMIEVSPVTTVETPEVTITTPKAKVLPGS